MADRVTRRGLMTGLAGAAAFGGAAGAVIGTPPEDESNGMLVFTYDDGPEKDYTKL